MNLLPVMLRPDLGSQWLYPCVELLGRQFVLQTVHTLVPYQIRQLEPLALMLLRHSAVMPDCPATLPTRLLRS